MKDFDNKDLKLGDVIFFKHDNKNPVIGKISEFEGKKTILVSAKDIVKAGPKLNLDHSDSLIVLCDEVIKL